MREFYSVPGSALGSCHPATWLQLGLTAGQRAMTKPDNCLDSEIALCNEYFIPIILLFSMN